MTRIEEAFYDKKAFISFITAGDPSLEVTKQLVIRMEQEGADLIEIGIPFSDPVAEGPVIQAANERALKAGTTTDKIFAMVKELRQSVKVPLVFLTYYNPIFTYGTERFLRNCQECGVDGVIVPDLPFEEKRELSDVCKQFGVTFISLIAPTSHERIKMIAKEAEGFIYCVSSLGVTGVRSAIANDIPRMVSLVRKTTDIPCAVGFGIATKEQAMAMVEIADGAIVGSAIVELVAKYRENAVDYVGDYVREMKQAVESVEEVQEKIAK
ncbi:MAG: tryptophan synthase subunit alpha [bacterium]|nr:tryptophan synthase subunit alpha [bacterium]